MCCSCKTELNKGNIPTTTLATGKFPPWRQPQTGHTIAVNPRRIGLTSNKRFQETQCQGQVANHKQARRQWERLTEISLASDHKTQTETHNGLARLQGEPQYVCLCRSKSGDESMPPANLGSADCEHTLAYSPPAARKPPMPLLCLNSHLPQSAAHSPSMGGRSTCTRRAMSR